MSDMETALAKRKAINRQVDGLIRAAAKSVQNLEGTDMRVSQLRNLLSVAAATQSVEEVTNFIRYQIGRTPRTWGAFGRAVIADIEADTVKKAADAVTMEVPEADPVEVRAELIALYVGYMNRCFVYAAETKDWQGLSGRLEAKADV